MLQRDPKLQQELWKSAPATIPLAVVVRPRLRDHGGRARRPQRRRVIGRGHGGGGQEVLNLVASVRAAATAVGMLFSSVAQLDFTWKCDLFINKQWKMTQV